MNSVRKSLALLGSLFLIVSLVNPAAAHTKLDKTSPSNGESVVAGAVTLSVSFTDKILDLADSSEIVLKGEDGSVSGVGCLTVDDRSFSAKAVVASPGEYQVAWRTVAEDGHPIDGSFKFTVTGESKDDLLTCENGQTVLLPQETEPEVISPAPDEKPEDSAGMLYNYLVGGALVAAAVAVTFLVRRRKPTK